jgi:hypothetical protein
VSVAGRLGWKRTLPRAYGDVPYIHRACSEPVWRCMSGAVKVRSSGWVDNQSCLRDVFDRRCTTGVLQRVVNECIGWRRLFVNFSIGRRVVSHGFAMRILPMFSRGSYRRISIDVRETVQSGLLARELRVN